MKNLKKKLIWKCSEKKKVREKVVSVEAQTRTNEAEMTVLLNNKYLNYYWLNFQHIDEFSSNKIVLNDYLGIVFS